MGSVLSSSAEASAGVTGAQPRMGLSELGNLLDSDGNLQNEMLVFAFAATLLATIPILLGNEFDVNVGLRRRRRQLAESPVGGAWHMPPVLAPSGDFRRRRGAGAESVLRGRRENRGRGMM
ncbi:uncharacterized protein LOC119112500 [Pollicipes pollicipes]|uniref:uncharacterized protein LOC119112500 n=1 Tax=Pollicipes pollicipes TaxID=41117 RepID=UPI001884B1F1|nr:uncharacterized protein LOC119112500 [Pollicipes pollicipes]